MSRKYGGKYWYPAIVDAIRNYKCEGTSVREKEVKDAIRCVMEEVAKEQDGDIVLELIRLTWIEDRYTLGGATNTIPGLSRRTAERMRSKFVYRVGHKLGY